TRCYRDWSSDVCSSDLPNHVGVSNHFSCLKDIFGDRLYIEAQRLSPGDGRMLREAERLGGELGVPLVATNNVHFLRPEEHLHHRSEERRVGKEETTR